MKRYLLILLIASAVAFSATAQVGARKKPSPKAESLVRDFPHFELERFVTFGEVAQGVGVAPTKRQCWVRQDNHWKKFL